MDDPGFEELLGHIQSTRGVDLTGYKRPSMTRRFRKRMHEVRAPDYEGYRRILDEHPEEFVELFDTILINVTSFFRDPPAWEYVAAEVIPRIVSEKGDHDVIRLWSAGCASGEEAYSAAMVLLDLLGEEGYRARVKIYATDIDKEALAEGRRASYNGKRIAGVGGDQLERYFDRSDGGQFVFRKQLRRSIIFGKNDLLRDPPISRVDLLLCRNTLMYFMADAQSSVLANFAFALNPRGALFLGKSEVLLTRSNHFVPLDLKRRIFCKAVGASQAEPRNAKRSRREPTIAANPPHEGIRRVAFETSPVAQFVVDLGGNLALANKAARHTLAIHPKDLGRPIQDLEISYRPLELRSLIEQAETERHSVSALDVLVTRPDGQALRFDVFVHPLSNDRGDVVAVSVAFMDTTRSRNLEDELEESRRELETAYEELQSTVEELETTNEELQSTNEELETTNEELQSTNEELETMNEELQSTNEELETMNDELRERTDEASQANAFLSSILASLQTGVIVVDDDFRVLAWNEGSEDLWGVRSDETVGQNLLGLDIGLPVELLRAPVRRCLATGAEEQVEVPARNRRGQVIVCAVKCSPLRMGPGDAPGGVIVLCEDRVPQEPAGPVETDR